MGSDTDMRGVSPFCTQGKGLNTHEIWSVGIHNHINENTSGISVPIRLSPSHPFSLFCSASSNVVTLSFRHTQRAGFYEALTILTQNKGYYGMSGRQKGEVYTHYMNLSSQYNNTLLKAPSSSVYVLYVLKVTETYFNFSTFSETLDISQKSNQWFSRSWNG